MKRYVFRSGILKVTIESDNYVKALDKLTEYFPDAWSDPSWNWKIEEYNV